MYNDNIQHRLRVHFGSAMSIHGFGNGLSWGYDNHEYDWPRIIFLLYKVRRLHQG